MTKPTTKVWLELHAQNLKKVAGFGYGSSDPYAVVTLLPNNPKQKPQVIGITEVIKNNLSPRWTEHFDLDFSFSQNTRINVGVWDAASKSENQLMGTAVFEVGEVLGAQGNTEAKEMRRGGTLFARIIKAPKIAGRLYLKLCGVKLKNVDGIFGKSDPFIEINARVETAAGLTWRPIYRNEPIMNNLNPDWPLFSLDIARLCEGNLDKPIQITVWDFERSGKHQSMGEFETSVNGLLAARWRDSGFSLVKKGKDFGIIVVKSANLEGHVGASA